MDDDENLSAGGAPPTAGKIQPKSSRRGLLVAPVMVALALTILASAYLVLLRRNPFAASDLESIDATASVLVAALLVAQILPYLDGLRAILRECAGRRTWARVGVEAALLGVVLGFYGLALGFNWVVLVLWANGYLVALAIGRMCLGSPTE